MAIADEIAKLKASCKVPFWRRWLGEYRAWKRARKALKEGLARKAKEEADKKIPHHVATVYHFTRWTDDNTLSRKWYILSEDGYGNRSYEFGSDSGYLKKKEKEDSVYAGVVAPWLKGYYTNQAIVEWCRKQTEPKDS